ncbi:MAG: hypothetical protein J5726_00775 [Treponema sp.]|nr:hypothetical protein [Treponema sp.]
MKKLQTRLAYTIIAVWSLTFIISLFPSCEIGLGAAVDTQPPSLTIETPKVDAVIRDVFALTGKWSDDGTIDDVRAELKRTDGKGETIKIDGTFAKDGDLSETGTWKVLVDYQQSNIGDGTYQATVFIKDKSRHETSQSTTFTVDNTAPVLVLSRPSIKDGQNGFDSYGRTFTLEGKAADDNDVNLIEVKIFENADSTEPMKVVELKNVPLTIEQDVAVYEANTENDYSVIYGNTEFGKAAQRYCTVTIYDGAQRYPEDGSAQSEQDKKGNSTNTYYMNSEMTSLLQGAFKITDLYHMLNGTYEAGESRSAASSNVLEQLEGFKVNKSKFSINPANNPKYIVSSGNVLEGDKNLDNIDYQLTAGNRYIEVEIAPGLDGYPIDPDTVGVYLQKCDINGEPLDDTKIWLINTGAEYHKTQEEAEAVSLESGYGIYSVSGSTYKFKTAKLIHKNNYDVAVGNYYLIMVDGNDSQGAGSGKIISDGKYGFKLVSNEEKIELSVQGVPDYLSKKQAAWQVEGHKNFTATLSWTTTAEGPFDVYRLAKDGQTFVKLTNLSSEPSQTDGVWHASEVFDYNSLKALAPDGMDFPEKLVYVLKKENSDDIISTTARINLKYDSDEPSISNIQFTNSYVHEAVTQDGSGNDVINYTYYVRNDGTNKSNITGIATDDTGIEKVELVVPGFANPFSSSESRFKFNNVDFSSLTAADITAQIIATDIAGNQITENLAVVFDTTAPHGVHEIDASSKNLYLRVGNNDNDDINSSDSLWNNALDKGVGGKYGNGTFGNATTIQIRGKFDDGDSGSGVEMIYYKIYEEEKKDLTAEQETALMNEVLQEPTGYFAPIEPVTKRIFYNVGKKLDTNGQPVLDAEGKPQPDESQIFSDSIQYTFEPNKKGYFKYYKNVESNFNANLTGFKEGNNYLVLVVKDNVGNTAIDAATVNFGGDDTRFINYTLNVDTTPPSDITTKSTSGIIYTNGTNVPQLWGTVSDKSSTANASAGLRSFVLTRDGVNTKITADLREVEDTDPDDIKALAQNDPTLRIWEADISTLLPEVEDGSKTVSISATATDDAGVGNTTPAVVATITVDTEAPTVLIDNASPSDADSETEGIQVNGTIALAGTSDDANGIRELVGLYYKTYTGDSMPAKPTSSTIDDWTQVSASGTGTVNWKFTGINTTSLDGSNPIVDGTKVCFSVAVKDNAGNIGYSAPKPIIVDQDTDRPVIHLSTLPLTYKYTDEYDQEQTQRMDSDHPVWFNRSELSGTIDDDDGAVLYVKVIAVDPLDTGSSIIDPPSNDNWESAPNVYKNGIWSYTIPSNGYKKIYFQIKDSAGNTFTSNTQSTDSSKYGPKIQDTESELFGYNTPGSCADVVIYVKVDTNDPVLEVMKYYTSSVLVDDPTTIPEYNSYTQEPGWKIAESSIIPDKFGGIKKYLYIRCKTYDTNGISSIALKFGDISPLEGKTVEIPQQDENYKEIIACFNINQGLNHVPSGLTKLEINIKDNAAANTGSSGISKYYEAMVDNTEPEINFSNYTKGSQVYGSSAVTLRGTTSDSSKVEKVEYALSDNGYAVPTVGWIEITDETKPTYTSKLGWQIVFDGKTPENDNTFTDPSSYHAALLKESLFSLYSIPQEQQAAYDTTQKIYIWMRATDELGNVGTNMPDENYEGFFLDVIPNGDRPAIEITYPADSSSVGGTIRITGTTDIQDTSASVKYVYLQIDPSYDKNAGFNAAWATELDDLLNPQEGNAVTSYSITDLTNVTVNGIDLGTKIGSGIASQGNSKMNWYLTINGNKEFNGKVNNNNRTIGIRAAAVSSTGKVSFSEIHACTIDPDAPIFGQTNELRFVQLDGQGNETASRKFENGVYLKGQWYLVGSVEDDSGLREIKLGSQSIVYSTGDEGAEVVTNASNGMVIENNNIPVNEGSRFKNYDLKIPVGNSEVDKFGKLDYEISVTDGSSSQIENTLKFTIFYDNKAPDFEAQKGNEILLETNGKIFQSNGSYTVKGIFAEPSEGANNQSGFNRIAMFFTRKRVEDGNTNLYLIDPMITGGEDQEKNFIKLGRLGNDGNIASYESNISFKEGLFWNQVTASLENTNELTVADGSLVEGELPSNIRAGGLCMINNVIYRIKSITGVKLILEGSIFDFTDKSVYFAFAQIIDNQSQESGTVGLYVQNDPTTNPDGDCMVEGVVFGAGIYNWNASINSSNMLDGNATMSFVAYDAAGNYTEQSFEQKISNNAPRIAGVEFGTDTNLDGDITGNEINEFYSGVFTHEANPSLNGYDNLGNRISSYTIPERLTVKGDVMLKPMIVGGNKALGQQYSFSTTTQSGTYSSTPTQYAGVEHSSSNNVRTDVLTINIGLTTFITNNVKEGDQNITFTIWDKTDGATLGDEASGSARADIILPVNIVINDNVDPTITIDPFYWKSQTENSLYQNNVKNGHIELIGELPTGNDGDAMVSGKITFDGTATDNVIVEKIYVSITGYDGGEGVGSPFAIAERDKTYTATDGWKSSSLYYKKNGEVVTGAANTLDTKDWVFELVSDTYDAEDGKNTVKFKFHFNTEKHPDVAKENVTFAFTVEDKGSPSSSGEYTNENSATADSKVDIVPYITKVYTALAKLKSNNWSVYNRTALGHYAVASDETIYLYGFNLGSSSKKPVYKFGNGAGDVVELAVPENAGKTNLGTIDDPVTPAYPCGSEYASYSVVTFPVANVPSSGAITLLVNGVPIQNNANNSDAKGSYAGTTSSVTGDKTVYDNYYNRQPNGDNNNLLTDDVELDVWEIDPTAVKPVNGYATQPVMAINPVTHDVGFAFVNGTLYYSMPNGNNGDSTYSYDLFIGGYDFWTSVGFAYDKLGYSYGTAAGGDIADNRADTFRIMTSRWGYANRDVNGYNDGLNQYRLEWIAQADYDSEGNLTRNFNKERIRSPSLTTTAATEDETTLYLAYYDEINNEIRFKWGYMPKTKNPDWYTNRNTSAQIATFLGDYYGENKDGNNGESNGKNTLEAHLGNYRLEHNSLIAGQTINKYTKNDKKTKVTTAVTTTGGDNVNAGKYVSIAAIEDGANSDDVVVVVWWDAENNQMLYSYNEAPKSISVGTYSQSATGWSAPVPVFGEGNGIGEYCKVVVDKNNGVHIAAYDGLGGDLWYAYMADYSSPEDANTCVVDSYGIIGTEINIDVALDTNNKPIPYISYYAGSCGKPKTAHWAGTKSLDASDITETLMESTNEEAFTGAWEVSVIPTSSKVSVDHINIGVWKDNSGVITYSTKDGLQPSGSNIGITELSYKESFYRMVSNSKSYGYKTGGQVYGNGSKNPILGYAVTKGSTGYIETAQMK